MRNQIIRKVDNSTFLNCFWSFCGGKSCFSLKNWVGKLTMIVWKLFKSSTSSLRSWRTLLTCTFCPLASSSPVRPIQAWRDSERDLSKSSDALQMPMFNWRFSWQTTATRYDLAYSQFSPLIDRVNSLKRTRPQWLACSARVAQKQFEVVLSRLQSFVKQWKEVGFIIIKLSKPFYRCFQRRTPEAFEGGSSKPCKAISSRHDG